MPAPLVQTPIQLAAYSRPPSAAQLPTNSRSDLHTAHVAVGDVVRISGQLRHRRDLVVTVEQGAAAVLLDLQSQSPLQTHTLAPSDRVTAPPLVVEQRTSSGLERTTYLAMAQGPVVKAHLSKVDPKGRILSEETHSIELPSEALALFPLPTNEIVALTHTEALIIHGSVTHKVSIAPGKRLDTSLLGPHEARELLANTDGARLQELAAALCIVTKQKKSLSVQVVAVYTRGERVAVFGGAVEGISRATACSVHGAHIAVHDDGELVSADLAIAPTSAAASQVRRVQLGDHRPASMLLVTPSHLLMVALLGESHGKERATALVWDVDYDTVLAQVEWSLGAGHGTPQVSIAPAGPEQAALQIDTQGDKGRTSVLVLPISVPPAGLLRHAVGTAAQTASWLKSGETTELLSSSEQQLIDTLTDARDPAAVDAAFRSWVDTETERIRAQVGGRKARPELGPALVAHVLDIALPTSEGAKHAQDTVRYLLERGAVSATMRGSTGDLLVSRIIETRDWTALQLVLRHVSDVSEAHAISILRDAFDTAAPPVARILAHVLAPPTFSKPQLRLALRRTITSEEQVLVLLDILCKWLDKQLAEPLEGAKKERVPDQEVEVGNTGIKYVAADVTPAPLGAVISFAEDLLDTYFPQLLAMPLCHAFLGETTRVITQHISALQTLSRLRGPLDAFAHHAEASKRGRTDSRSRRLALYEASLVVPPYSVEKLEV
ncbi:hypothetical protein MCUN1_002796 [Malassezia cuniculi]|uniref:Uncharacterized protein n=1 Tax=Malassezia cuniculi TaxID=948313 RepID=A0AAF0J7B4_9BASI|nr:hypothetical protein MCUN1_002796 [Malassezia cuniculi]